MKVARPQDPFLFFSKKEKEHILQVIREAEKQTSGEIRVHLERKAKDDILKHAAEVFERLGMAKTEKHNGVLIFMGVRSKRFCILGDLGIHEKVPAGFWNEIAQMMGEHFRKDEFAEGIVKAIEKAGKKLALYFPYQPDDVNELPDEISYA